MKKVIQKEFVVCKDVNYCDVQLNKGDVVQLFPLEFFDKCEPSYRSDVIELGMQPDLVLDFAVLSPDQHQQQFIDGNYDFKLTFPVDIRELPYLFNTLKIAPRNVIIEVENEF